MAAGVCLVGLQVAGTAGRGAALAPWLAASLRVPAGALDRKESVASRISVSVRCVMLSGPAADPRRRRSAAAASLGIIPERRR